MPQTSHAALPGYRLKSGHQLSHPSPGEEVVISGISGYFPDSDSVVDFRENLFNKVDLVSGDDRRWKLSHPEIPQRTGKINKLNKFDASFFGVHYKEAHAMDPMSRLLMEKTYEAIVDAGVNPEDLRNTKTGVFIAASFSESENTWLYQKIPINAFGIAGCSRSMYANRISRWLGVTGPSYSVDTACSSSLYAMEHAFRSIREGHCDAAIVGGANLCIHPHISFQFFRLGVLSADGKCKTFDNTANGYARSEAVVAVFLQKAKDSKRIYAQVIHAKTNCDGYKEQGITYPAGHVQKMLLSEFYEECSINPTDLEYIEAHGTGTKVGDPEELNAIDSIFCGDSRTGSLLVGSVKSNMGHSEPASGLCSIAKLCIAYNTGYVPPNLYYKTPREGVSVLAEGRVKVVTEKMPWNRGLSGVNSFGFGGANAHVLLKNITNQKDNDGLPSDDLPRLVCVSGRTESAVEKILDDLESRSVDVELVRLWHSVHSRDISRHIVRGYTLLGTTPMASECLGRSTQYFFGTHRPVCFVYSGLGSQWAGMGAQLMKIPVFATSIERCHQALAAKGLNLKQLIRDADPKIFDNIVHSFVAIAAIQIGLTDVLKGIGIKPNYIIGHSVGELGCAYADGCLTAEEMVLSAYYRGLVSIKTKCIKGSMVAIGLGYNQVKTMCPPEIEVVAHDGPNSSTLSGPADMMKPFVATLTAKGICSKELNVSNIAFHSKYVATAGIELQKYLRQLIRSRKHRSDKWMSTSFPQKQWKDRVAELSPAEYHTKNFLNPVLFEETSRQIPSNAITIEIAPHGLLQDVLHQSLNKDVINVALMNINHKDNVQYLFNSVGKLYEAGLNPQLANLYPHVPFPVSVSTPMMAHLVEWEHSEDWHVTSYKQEKEMKSVERVVLINNTEEDTEFLKGHVVDGRNLYPATGYLVLVWETLGKMKGVVFTELSVVFENVRFRRATNIPKKGDLGCIISIQKTTGYFEITENEVPIVTGRIYTKKNVGKSYRDLPFPSESSGPNVVHLLTKDFYKELRLRGYQYSGSFKSVLGCNIEGTRGRIAWHDNLVSFMDCMLQMKIIGRDTRGLFVPTRIEKVSFDTDLHYTAITKMNSDVKSFEVRVFPDVDVIRCGGVEIRGLHATPISKKASLGVPVLEKIEFIPNYGITKLNVYEIIQCNIHLFFENVSTYKIKCIELYDEQCKQNDFEPLMEKVLRCLEDIPMIQSELSVISEDKLEMPSNIKVENKNWSGESNIDLFIGANLLGRPEILHQAISTLREKCFIMTREETRPNLKDYSNKYDIVTIQNTGSEFIVMFRNHTRPITPKYVRIVSSDQTFSWVDAVKQELKEGQKVVLYSQDEPINGLLGLVSCLRKEPGGENVYGILIADPNAPPFNPDVEIYKKQLDMDLALNILQDGQWGTYRNLLMGDVTTIKAYHAYVKSVSLGDLSSLKWLEGPITEGQILVNPNSILIHVYCAALNFRDIMIATGRITVDAVASGRLAQDCVQGFEVVGRTLNGSRVMAMVRNRGIANIVEASSELVWAIPDEWTFEEAATVPVSYGTVYYAMIMVGQLQRGESILIHAGSGGVGQAAINVALHYGCEVFTTVGTAEKRAFIKRLFPQIDDRHIGNSRDASFEDMIYRETNGKGVDMVLNSLSDEKLQASVRCLSKGGRFLEIGRFDIGGNTLISLNFIQKEVSFHGIMLDHVYSMDTVGRKILRDLISNGIESGAVRPLTYCKFEKHEIETAFRYMAAGKHIGKVIFRIRDEEGTKRHVKPACMPVDAVPRYMCNESSVYILVGGLGGFGLELADWLVMRGARKLVISSRKGVSNGYQASRIRAWSSYGADVRILTYDITTASGCEEILKMASAMGPVKAIFNLAVVLKDALFQNQTPESFKISSAAKALATLRLDKYSRILCPELTDFVVFSSVSCGRGNAGQTNYGFSNSMMERICEQRKKLGFPALAIQWGAVGDVGIVADMQDEDFQLEIGGTLQQRISSCLETLDTFMKQDATIVSSIVVAEIKAGQTGEASALDVVAEILGIKDFKTIPQQATFVDLGMDSMMAVEINQKLEREFEIFLTAKEIRILTFARLAQLTSQSNTATSTLSKEMAKAPVGFNIALKNLGDEKKYFLPYIFMPTAVSDGSEENVNCDAENILFLLPGVEGFASVFEPLCRTLETKACVLQFSIDHPEDSLSQMVDKLYESVRTRITSNCHFKLLGYSFGTLPMIELAARLEEGDGCTGTIFCLDGAPDFLNALMQEYIKFDDDFQLQNNVIFNIINNVTPTKDVVLKAMEKLNHIDSYNERLHTAFKMCNLEVNYSKKFLEAATLAVVHRFKAVKDYDYRQAKQLKSHIVLLRPTEAHSHTALEETYGLDKYTDNLTVHYFDANHVTITENKDCADTINRIIKDSFFKVEKPKQKMLR